MKIAGQTYELHKKTHIMGILNVTPDSFSDGGKYFSFDDAIKKGFSLAEQGADFLDIGGESSRPGAKPVSSEEEKKRVVPVITVLAKQLDIPISIDTYKPDVAEAALDAGASIINDISGLGNEKMAPLAANRKAAVVIMHMKGNPQTMQNNVTYLSVIDKIKDFFSDRIDHAIKCGIPKENIMLDPGIGFGKYLEHNLEILNRLSEFSTFNLPLLIGTSRKSFIGTLLDRPVDKRLEGDLACVASSIYGGASIVRVHDVDKVKPFTTVMDAISRFKHS